MAGDGDGPGRGGTRRGVTCGLEVPRDDVPRGRGGFEAEASDGDGGAIEDSAVEGLGFAAEQGFNARPSALGGPTSAGSLQGQPLRQRFGGSAAFAEGDGAQAEGVVPFPCAARRGGGEGEGLKDGGVPNDPSAGVVDSSGALPPLRTGVADEAGPLRRWHAAVARGG